MKKNGRRWAAWLCAVLMLGLPGVSSARYATLEYGSRGAEVLRLQQALQALGYNTNGTDGKFGRGTEKAVRLFQEASGLTADGKAGHLTLSKLYDGGTSSAASTGSTASSGVAYNPNTLKPGDSGPRVTELQTLLKKLGFYSSTVDGTFGEGTQRAVIAFQKANGLAADGLAGTRTQDLLARTAAAEQTSPSAAAPSNASGFTRTLRRGYMGQDVVQVQTRLQALGYYNGTIDGKYGSGSISAITAFQRRNGLTADGLTGRQTWNLLMSASAVAAQTGPATGAAQTESVSPSASAVLQSGDRGEAVKKLQKALQALNYNVSADGSYGAQTESAVRQFQKVNGLTQDGVAGEAVQKLLYGGNAQKNPSTGTGSASGSGSFGTVSGPSGSSVRLLHWFNEVKPTLSNSDTLVVYDPATSLQWNLRVYSRGRHCDSEPRTANDTAIMNQAFGGKADWTPKPVYVKLPSGVWTLATTHNVPHESNGIKDNDFNGHLCVHFLRDMDECRKNDPNYGVQHQNAIRKAWKNLTGITVD